MSDLKTAPPITEEQLKGPFGGFLHAAANAIAQKLGAIEGDSFTDEDASIYFNVPSKVDGHVAGFRLTLLGLAPTAEHKAPEDDG